MSRPFAIHITWTCYGTWLPGDDRGYVSNTLRPDGSFAPRVNTPGVPYTRGEPATKLRARANQKWDTVWLNPDQAACVVTALIEAAGQRQWRILRAAVMPNHTHVVVCDCPDDGPAVRRVLKGVTQAVLSQAFGGRRWWTEAGSDRYKHNDAAITAAVGYVADQDGMLAGVADMRPFAVMGGETKFIGNDTASGRA